VREYSFKSKGSTLQSLVDSHKYIINTHIVHTNKPYIYSKFCIHIYTEKPYMQTSLTYRQALHIQTNLIHTHRLQTSLTYMHQVLHADKPNIQKSLTYRQALHIQTNLIHTDKPYIQTSLTYTNKLYTQASLVYRQAHIQTSLTHRQTLRTNKPYIEDKFNIQRL
jgi:hypothetical protein